MTRAASGAQRSGAAALIINFAHPREVYTLSTQYFASSFFVPRTPARASRIRLWYSRSGGRIAGSVVLYGSGGRTANHLKSNGSTVLFWSLTRDACAGACTRAHKGRVENYRTTELNHKTQLSCGFAGSVSLPFQNRHRTGNKQWGGYCLPGFAAADGGRQSGDRLYPGLDRGAAGGKFRAGARVAGGGGVVGGLDGAGGANRAISTGYAGRIGHVGMPVSERSAIIAPFQRVARCLRKPAGLAGAVALGRPAALVDRGGVASIGEGGTPPSAARLSSLPCAQPIFRVSVDLRIRGCGSVPMAWDGRNSSGVKMGSGVGRLSPVTDAGRGGAIGMRQERVGVQGGVLGWGRSRERMTLWGGFPYVN